MNNLRLEAHWLESRLAEKPWWALLTPGEPDEPEIYPCSEESHQHPELHQAKPHQQVRGGYSCSLLSTGETNLEWWFWLWPPQDKGDMGLLEHIHQKAIKVMKGLEHFSNEEKLRECSSVQPREDKIQVGSYQWLPDGQK